MTDDPNAREKERQYQHDYYKRRRKKLLAERRHRWRTDPSYRERETERARKARAIKRSESAEERFESKVEEKKDLERVPRRGRLVEIDGKREWTYTTGSLGAYIGREPNTIRAWMDQGVLPGASIFIGNSRRFTRGFCDAVRAACRRLYFISGRGERSVLRRLIMEELERAGESYVPKGGTEEDRIRLSRRRKESAA